MNSSEITDTLESGYPYMSEDVFEEKNNVTFNPP